MPRFSPLLAFLILVGLIALLSLFGPREASLGANVRLVYLHGAWVWTALVGFGAAALAGLVGLLFRRPRLQAWSVALGIALCASASLALPVLGRALTFSLIGLFLFYVCFEFTLVTGISLMTELVPGARATVMAGNLSAHALGRTAWPHLSGSIQVRRALFSGIGLTARRRENRRGGSA